MSIAAQIPPPPLRDGERLSREEFLRRWEAMPNLLRAELIDGIVHMPSPISTTHGTFQSLIDICLGVYAASTPGCETCIAATWLMCSDSVPQPDLTLRILPEYGGQSRLEGIYAAGAPELAVEISLTTSARDYGAKFRLYERNGVQEYLIVQPRSRRLVWHVLEQGKYQESALGADGIFRSRVFPGLWLNPEQLWNRDYAGIVATAQLGTSTPEHAAFVQQLAARQR